MSRQRFTVVVVWQRALNGPQVEAREMSDAMGDDRTTVRNLAIVVGGLVTLALVLMGVVALIA